MDNLFDLAYLFFILVIVYYKDKSRINTMDDKFYRLCWMSLKHYIRQKNSHGKNEILNAMVDIEIEQNNIERLPSPGPEWGGDGKNFFVTDRFLDTHIYQCICDSSNIWKWVKIERCGDK